jgi:hypothetical protein
MVGVESLAGGARETVAGVRGRLTCGRELMRRIAEQVDAPDAHALRDGGHHAPCAGGANLLGQQRRGGGRVMPAVLRYY